MSVHPGVDHLDAMASNRRMGIRVSGGPELSQRWYIVVVGLAHLGE